MDCTFRALRPHQRTQARREEVHYFIEVSATDHRRTATFGARNKGSELQKLECVDFGQHRLDRVRGVQNLESVAVSHLENGCPGYLLAHRISVVIGGEQQQRDIQYEGPSDQTPLWRWQLRGGTFSSFSMRRSARVWAVP